MSEQIEGRNAVLEAFRSGKCVDKLFILSGWSGKNNRERGTKDRHHY